MRRCSLCCRNCSSSCSWPASFSCPWSRRASCSCFWAASRSLRSASPRSFVVAPHCPAAPPAFDLCLITRVARAPSECPSRLLHCLDRGGGALPGPTGGHFGPSGDRGCRGGAVLPIGFSAVRSPSSAAGFLGPASASASSVILVVANVVDRRSIPRRRRRLDPLAEDLFHSAEGDRRQLELLPSGLLLLVARVAKLLDGCQEGRSHIHRDACGSNDGSPFRRGPGLAMRSLPM